MNESSSTSAHLATIQEAAKAFRVHHQTIREWLRRGAPHIRVGKVVRVDIADLRDWARCSGQEVTDDR